MIGGAGQVDGGTGIENIDRFHLMAGADFVIIEIMGWSNLQASGAKFRIHIIIGNDGYRPACEGKQHALSHQIPIALILRMDRHRGIP